MATGRTKPVVVVGVLADEVDATRGVDDADGAWIGRRQRFARDQRVAQRVGVAGEGGVVVCEIGGHVGVSVAAVTRPWRARATGGGAGAGST